MRRIGLALALALVLSLTFHPGAVWAKGKGHHHGRPRHFHHHLLPHWFDRRPPLDDPCCGQSAPLERPAPKSPESGKAAIPTLLPLQHPSPESP